MNLRAKRRTNVLFVVVELISFVTLINGVIILNIKVQSLNSLGCEEKLSLKTIKSHI